MASIFNALHIGYSGLSAAQVGISTTGHNIANAETEGYSRQRVVTAAATPLYDEPGNIGNGVEVQTIKRVFDNFVFDRYTDMYGQKEYNQLEKSSLEQLSTYFPEIDAVGVKADLQEYYNMWQTLADNPDNDSIKLSLAKQSEVLSEHIGYTQNQVKALQMELNDQLEVNINEVNSIAKQITAVNKSIDEAEAGGLYEASDLRDKRNLLESDLSRLIGAEINRGQLEANIQIDTSANTSTGSYTINVNGFNIVDGASYHPIHITNSENENGFYEVSFENQDGTLVPMEESIDGGKIGAIFELRGGVIDTTSGVPRDGVIQNTIAQLDAFASTIIETTNNLYAQSATTRMDSNQVTLNPDNSLMTSNLNIKEGSFSVSVYDVDGNKVATRSIDINVATSMEGALGSNSIEGQLTQSLDDNDDGNANNDVDDYVNFNWASFANNEGKLELTLDPYSESQGYTFAIEDNLKSESFSSGTNFAGAMGMSRFFDGDSATSMDLNYQLKENPTIISAGYSNLSGDSHVALDMVQHQFENYEYEIGDMSYNTTSYGMFDIVATEVGTHTNAAIMKSETINTQFNAIELEYYSTSKVSIDEEMTNLIKYQTSYGAAAKVITTIDQMMQTLLGIKT